MALILRAVRCPVLSERFFVLVCLFADLALHFDTTALLMVQSVSSLRVRLVAFAAPITIAFSDRVAS